MRESFCKKNMLPIAEEQDGTGRDSAKIGMMESVDLLQISGRSKDKSTDRQHKTEVLTCSVSDLLASQDLDEVFKSFKKHELEFEGYLRPIMQEVLAEEMQDGNGDLIKDVRCWESSKTWGFLQKQVCHDNHIVREMVHEDKRDKMVNRIRKMHMHQL